jgi:hypothetical protein
VELVGWIGNVCPERKKGNKKSEKQAELGQTFTRLLVIPDCEMIRKSQ